MRQLMQILAVRHRIVFIMKTANVMQIQLISAIADHPAIVIQAEIQNVEASIKGNNMKMLFKLLFVTFLQNLNK